MALMTGLCHDMDGNRGLSLRTAIGTSLTMGHPLHSLQPLPGDTASGTP